MNLLNRILNLFSPSLKCCDEVKELHSLIKGGAYEKAFDAANNLKAQKEPRLGLDLVRAEIFLSRNEPIPALQAVYEELRYFPENEAARRVAKHILKTLNVNESGKDVFSLIRPYTMVQADRLSSLYKYAREICLSDIVGNFVECGVAAGGTSGLLSHALHQYDKTEKRRLFSFDSFDGMPAPTEEDTHGSTSAHDSGWGEGTCAAPMDSLFQLLDELGTAHLVMPVKGFFASTLPIHKDLIGPIALLHMDGDWYESTRDILNNLYDQLSEGAYVQVDDYGYWEGCKKALHDFFDSRGLDITLNPIDGTGIFFFKP